MTRYKSPQSTNQLTNCVVIQSTGKLVLKPFEMCSNRFTANLRAHIPER